MVKHGLNSGLGSMQKVFFLLQGSYLTSPFFVKQFIFSFQSIGAKRSTFQISSKALPRLVTLSSDSIFTAVSLSAPLKVILPASQPQASLLYRCCSVPYVNLWYELQAPSMWRLNCTRPEQQKHMLAVSVASVIILWFFFTPLLNVIYQA